MMVIAGRVENGVVVLEHGASLPEGTEVSVVVGAAPRGGQEHSPYPLPKGEGEAEPTVEKRRIQLPLVRTNQPGTLHLTNERIAEILDAEDAAPRH